nr:ABC transporter ATP-binding protein [Actinomycetota bacterium]
FQRKCFGKIFEFKQRGGTIVFVSHDATAVERLCERAVLLRDGTVDFDGPTHDAISRYHLLLAAEQDPEERSVGLREWGSGEVRIVEVELLGPEDTPRRQFLAGEPLTLRLRVVSEAPIPAPRLSFELRGEGGLLLAAGEQDTAELGWRNEALEHILRFELERMPLAEGRFQLRFGLADATGERLFHWLDDAARFLVYPASGERGPLRLEGKWSTEEIEPAAEMRGR